MKGKISMLLAAVCSIFGGTCCAGEPLELGKGIPEVEAKTQEGKTIKLHEEGAKGWMLVYFYPKADTPGCTKQACSLRDAYATLTEKGVKVFGVSTDTVEEQKAFAEKFELPFTLLADKEAVVVKKFGVPTMKDDAFASRQAYLFKDGKLVWRDLKASTEQQAADVLKEIGE
ncbi:MAG: peroxiredoxin [Verrucomicrobia bacterium]|nr:peroxiredoxin [Verrucomicrobiota bacterium]MDA1005655.1 peroxiredoxin [Verrucomicrobiota bacterium]